MNTLTLRAVLIEPVAPDTLAPLLERRPYGLLPLANRPLLAGLLAQLAEAGIHEVDLYLARQPEMTRALVGKGEAWGLQIRCHSIDDPQRLWQKPFRCISGEGDTLILGMELEVDIALLVSRMSKVSGNVQLNTAGGLPLPALRLNAAANPVIASLPWPEERPGRLLTPKALWQANLRCLDALHATLHTETRLHAACYLAPDCRLHDSVHLSETTLIGRGTVLANQVTIAEHGLIGAQCYLDEHAEISDSLVFDGSYIGPYAYLRGKIIDQSCLVDIETGQAVYIDDPSLLGASADVLNGRTLFKQGYEWGLALLALLLTLPCLLAWCLGCWLRGHPALVRDRLYVPTRRSLEGRMLYREVSLFSLAGNRHPAWRRQPWLLAVLGRQLNLVGAARPLSQPCDELATGNTVYGMLQWHELDESENVASLGQADYLPNASFSFSLRVLLDWLIQLLTPVSTGVRT